MTANGLIVIGLLMLLMVALKHLSLSAPSELPRILFLIVTSATLGALVHNMARRG